MLTRLSCHIPHRIISGVETRKQRGSPTSAGQAACLRAHDDQHQEQPRLVTSMVTLMVNMMVILVYITVNGDIFAIVIVTHFKSLF